MNKEQTAIEVDANLTLEQYLQKYSYMPTRSFTEDDWQLAMTERWQNLQDEHSTQNIEVDALEWWKELSGENQKRITAIHYEGYWFKIMTAEQIEIMYLKEHPTAPTVADKEVYDIPPRGMGKEYNPAPTVEKNNEAYTKGEWELSFARWAAEGLAVGFNIKCGQKQIVTFNVNNESQVISPEAIKNFPELLVQHLSQEEMEANAELIASAPRLKRENKNLLEDNDIMAKDLKYLGAENTTISCRLDEALNERDRLRENNKSLIEALQPLANLNLEGVNTNGDNIIYQRNKSIIKLSDVLNAIKVLEQTK